MNRLLREKQLPKIFFLGCMFLAYLYSTPYLSIYLFKSEIERKEINRAEKYVNLTSVRKSVKPQVTSFVKDKVKKESYYKEVSPISLSILDSIIEVSINSIIDSIVTIKGLKLLMDNGYLIELKSDYEKDSKDIKADIKLYYQSINTFILSSQIAGHVNPTKTIWKREKLFHWRLSFVELSSDYFN